MPINTSSKQACISTEVSHLVKKKGYKQDQAIAAAYSICKGVKKNELELDLLKTLLELAKRKRDK